MPTRITTTHVVTDGEISGLLSCAFEGGSNYWYQIENYRFPKGTSMKDFREGGKHQNPDDYWHPSELIPLHDGCEVIVSCEDHTNKGNAWTLNREGIDKALQLMYDNYPKHWGALKNLSEDATTGDIFLQLALFGEVVFG